MESLYKYGRKLKEGYKNEVRRNYEKDKWLSKTKGKSIIPFLSNSNKVNK